MSFAPVLSRADPPQASFERLDQRFGEARPFPPGLEFIAEVHSAGALNGRSS
jgi:hypothetical protein